MTKAKYHHGDLKKTLIVNGLHLLNKEGYDGFSLRKVAILCGVSHAAPYKHFKNKEELIFAIINEVSESFISMIKQVAAEPAYDARTRLLEMGKQYVRFMVENPDYFKFIFLTDHNNPIVLKGNQFELRENHPFGIAMSIVTDYLISSNQIDDNADIKVLSVWSMIHGLTVFLVNRTIGYQGDYEQLVTKLMEETKIL